VCVAVLAGLLPVRGGHYGAVVVGPGVFAQRVAGVVPGVLQPRLLGGALILDRLQGGLLVRRGGADAQRGGVLWLVGVVLGGGRRLVLQVNRVCAKTSVCAGTSIGDLESKIGHKCRTCSNYLWARHDRSGAAVQPGVVMAVVVVEGPPRNWGCGATQRNCNQCERRPAQVGDCGGAAPLYGTGVAGRIRAQ
jgi:hypothetical protein